MITEKQAKDIECIKYFIPKVMATIPVTDEDISMFLEYSDKGMHKDKLYEAPHKDFTPQYWNGLNALAQGKKKRGLHMRMWEEGLMEAPAVFWISHMAFYELIENDGDIFPRPVVDFMKREMFKGGAADLIETTYQELLGQKEASTC